ncbi:MAG: hypothetical protein IIB42_08720 [Candidatus Marinimicrobia bacterium]|nr:hypothetical protein [Candidatus Neomarinimicrobiota bacterium]
MGTAANCAQLLQMEDEKKMKVSMYKVSATFEIIANSKVEASALTGALLGQLANGVSKWFVSDPEKVDVPDKTPKAEGKSQV